MIIDGTGKLIHSLQFFQTIYHSRRLIELRNGLRCMLVTNNVHEHGDEEEDNDGDSDDTT